MANAIMVVFPYRYQQTWVFDNDSTHDIKKIYRIWRIKGDRY